MVRGGCCRLRVGYSPSTPLQMLLNDLRLKQPLPKKSYAPSSRGADVTSKVRGLKRMPGALHRGWLVFDNQSKEMAKHWFQTNRYVLTGVCRREVRRATWMSNPIRRALPVSSGLSLPRIVVLPCGLDHLVKSSGWGPLNKLSTSVWATA